MSDDTNLFVREQIVRIDHMIAETQKAQAEVAAMRMPNPRAWLLMLGIVLAMAALSPLSVAILERVWPA